jgi:macrocin-O-methyltransferase TylF-like protien
VKVLFVLRHGQYGRNFEHALKILAQRGHVVNIALEHRGEEQRSAAIANLTEQYENVSCATLPAPTGDVDTLAHLLRRSIDFLRYLTPAYRDAARLRRRWGRGVPDRVMRFVHTLLGRTRVGLWLLRRVLRALERSLPLPEGIVDRLRREAPDIVLVSPLIDAGRQSDYVRAARAAGIPTGLVVASWDNLTNKGLMHEIPDRIYVWNGVQEQEAVQLQGVPRDRIRIVGAHSFDHWFEWRPSTTREQFCAKVGIDPARPILLYVGSSRFVANGISGRLVANGISGREVGFVSKWIHRIRASRHEALREATVLVRPHPQSGREWQALELEGLPNLVVYPPTGEDPQEDRGKRDYYDSIYHSAAVVGINTSALLEAAIIGRRIFSWRAPECHAVQAGTIHFRYLEAERGGPLVAADSFAAHAKQLAAALRKPEDGGWSRPFVETFLRPRSIERPAAPFLVDELEDLATTIPARPLRRTMTQRVLARWIVPRLALRAESVTTDERADDAVLVPSAKAAERPRPTRISLTPSGERVRDVRAASARRKRRRATTPEPKNGTGSHTATLESIIPGPMVSPETVAALVKETAAADPDGLKSALKESGYALFEKKPSHHYVPDYYGKLASKLRSPLEDREFFALAQKVVKAGRTFLDYNRLYTLFQGVQNVVAATDDDPIRLLEVGVYLGGSSYFIASAAQIVAPGRVQFVGVDTFEGHSALDLADGREGRHGPGTFGDTTLESVAEYLSPFDFADLVQGRIQDVRDQLGDRRWHLAHLDVDIYEPTSFALSFLDSRLAPRGVIVVDDYGFVTCEGVKRAVDEFAEERACRYFKLELDSGQCCLIATA